MTLRIPRGRRVLATAALAALFALGGTLAEARPGGGGSFGSRGGRTFSAPAPTATAPGMARPMERSMAQPGSPAATGGLGAPAQPRRFGLGTGFVAGLLGAGLFGALLGHGFLGGLGGIASLFGFLIQIALVVLIASFVVRWFRRRQGEPAMAGAGSYARQASSGPGPRPMGGGGGLGTAPSPSPVTVGPADYEAFERNLGAVQAAYSAEDLNGLRSLATPEMVSYFSEELTANSARGVVNRITDVKLVQGDLSEAWREGAAEYATVAMRYTLSDVTVERASGRVVETGDGQAVELWTFRRDRGGPWLLSAIQQTR